MGPTGFPETSVTNYQSMLRNIAEDIDIFINCNWVDTRWQ